MLDTLSRSGVWGWVLLLGFGAPILFMGVLRLFRPRVDPLASAGSGPRFDYVIRPAPGEWLALSREQFAQALRPSSVPCSTTEGWGDHRIRARDVEIAFACENDTVQVSFEGRIERVDADRLVDEIRESIAGVTGQALEAAPA